MAYKFTASTRKVDLSIQPVSTITAGTPTNTPSPPSGNLMTWNNQTQTWQPVTSINSSEPTVVITHGWNGQIADTGWTASMASALYKQANGNANILGYDWHAQAVSIPGQAAVSVPIDVLAEGLSGAAASARRGNLEGVTLANDLHNLGVNDSNLQLIGHSNGGAVVGSAASNLLALGGQPVERITTLDAPNLSLGEVPAADLGAVVGGIVPPWTLLTRVNAMQYVHANTASQVEVYYSDGVLGRSVFGLGSPLLGSSATNVFNGRIYPNTQNFDPFDFSTYDHFRIPGWYLQTVAAAPGQGQFVAGINWAITSPNAGNWQAGNFTEQGYNTGVFGQTSVTQQNVQHLVNVTVDGFEDGTNWLGQQAQVFMRDAGNAAVGIFGGNGSQLQGGIRPADGSGGNGYLYRDVSIPQNASYLTYDLMVRTPSAGDFLTVSLGSEVIDYQPLDTADTSFRTVDPIFVGDYAGQTETLLFTLNHVGTGTPLILLDNITFSAVPQPGDANGDSKVDIDDSGHRADQLRSDRVDLEPGRLQRGRHGGRQRSGYHFDQLRPDFRRVGRRRRLCRSRARWRSSPSDCWVCLVSHGESGGRRRGILPRCPAAVDSCRLA